MPATKKSKKSVQLTVDQIMKDDAKYEQLQKITFEDGSFTEVYKRFRTTTISKMLEDYFLFLADYEKIRTQDNEDVHSIDLLDYLNLFIVLYFSKLVVKLPRTLAEKIYIFQKIIDHDLIEHIFESFNKKEVEKVYNQFFRKIESYQKLIEGNEILKKQYNDHVKDTKGKEDN